MILRRVELAAEGALRHLLGAPRPSVDRHDAFAGLLPWDLTTCDALTVPRIARTNGTATGFDAVHGAQLLEFAGVCHLSQALDKAHVNAYRASATARHEAVRERLRHLGHDPNGRFRFHEACQRGHGRIDMRLSDDATPFDASELGSGAPWLPLVRQALGDDARLLWRGVVATSPGAEEQAAHADGPPVGYDTWRRHADTSCDVAMQRRVASGGPLPIHALTVFVPLVDTNMANGATSFYPGTHHVSTMQALAAEAAEAGCASGAGAAARLDAIAGDALIFDYRLFHFGGANRSARVRPILYLVYARSWFDDIHNFPGPEISLALDG